jgi:hypothetical protein
MRKREKGSITIFASLLMLLLLAILCTTLESARIAGMKAMMTTAGDAAGFSVFSEYNNQLLEEYELFFLEDSGQLESSLKEYLSYYENPLKGLNGIYGSTYYPFEVENIEVEKIEKALDNKAFPVEKEITNVMKNIETKEILSKLTTSFGWMKKAENISSYMDQWMEKARDILKVQEMVTDVYEKCKDTKQSYEVLEDQIVGVKNNIEEYNKAIDTENETLMEVYQSQISVSVENFNTQKTVLLKQLNTTKTVIDTYIKKSEELNQSLTSMDTVEEVETQDISDFINQENENLKKMKLLSTQGQNNINLVNGLENIKEDSDIVSVEKAVAQWEENLKNYKEMAVEQQKTTSTKLKDFNLLDTVKQVMTEGVLSLVVEDIDTLSKREFTTENFPSKESNVKNSQTSVADQAVNAVLLNEYLLKYMPNFMTKNTEDVQYDLEYVIGGKTSDKENLAVVVDKLVMLRQAMNYVYLLSDTEKKTLAQEMAMAVLGVASVTVVTVPVVTTLILMSWAYAESICDVKAMLAGQKVSFLKSKAEWNLSLENVTKGTKSWSSDKKSDKGLSYEEYLRILLYFQTRDSKIYRALDMIQLNISKEIPQFQIKNCIYHLEANATLRAKPMFLSFPFVEKMMSGNMNYYTFSTKVSYGY